MLERCDGPECPRCGCQETTPTYARSRWGGGSIARLKCGACGYVFTEGPRWKDGNGDDDGANGQSQQDAPPVDTPAATDGVVEYRPVRCPACKSTDVQTTSTRRPLRYHKCRACDYRFKSREATT